MENQPDCVSSGGRPALRAYHGEAHQNRCNGSGFIGHTQMGPWLWLSVPAKTKIPHQNTKSITRENSSSCTDLESQQQCNKTWEFQLKTLPVSHYGIYWKSHFRHPSVRCYEPENGQYVCLVSGCKSIYRHIRVCTHQNGFWISGHVQKNPTRWCRHKNLLTHVSVRLKFDRGGNLFVFLP